MFERFTDQARRAVVLAQEEARMLGHGYIGTEHILLGLLSEGESIAARALGSLEITLEAAREQVSEIIGEGTGQPAGHIPFTRVPRRSSNFRCARHSGSVTAASAPSTSCSGWPARARASAPRSWTGWARARTGCWRRS